MGLSRVIDSVNVCGMLLRNRKHLQDLQLDIEESQDSTLTRSLNIR